jgi:hypothetical protein
MSPVVDSIIDDEACDVGGAAEPGLPPAGTLIPGVRGERVGSVMTRFHGTHNWECVVPDLPVIPADFSLHDFRHDLCRVVDAPTLKRVHPDTSMLLTKELGA